MRIRTLAVVLLVLACATLAPGQISAGSVGLMWTSASAGSVGSLGCGPNPFTCTLGNVSVSMGEQVTLDIRAGVGGTYVVAFATQTVPCVPVAGFANALLIDLSSILVMLQGPVLPVVFGPLACPDGLGTLTFAWPAGLGGQTFFLQAAAGGPLAMPAFTNGIRITSL